MSGLKLPVLLEGDPHLMTIDGIIELVVRDCAKTAQAEGKWGTEQEAKIAFELAAHILSRYGLKEE